MYLLTFEEENMDGIAFLRNSWNSRLFRNFFFKFQDFILQIFQICGNPGIARIWELRNSLNPVNSENSENSEILKILKIPKFLKIL
jgi:DNA-binding GntR family transcriptional regulator